MNFSFRVSSVGYSLTASEATNFGKMRDSILLRQRTKRIAADTKDATREDVNNLGGSVGLLVQSPSDASVDEIPTGDLETAKVYAKRVQAIVNKIYG